MPRSPGESTTTTETVATGAGVKAVAPAAAGVDGAPWGAAVAAGDQQKNAATSSSAQTGATSGALPLRRRWVHPLALLIPVIVRGG